MENALVIGVEKISKYLNKEDINTVILLGDGAGATLLGKARNKRYAKNIESIGKQGDILTCKENEKLFMDGKKDVYKRQADLKPGNCMRIENIPVGTMIHNIELNPGQGGN